ncbi:ABC transporter ATP-binding protein [Calidifontibacillus erzurumensis]|uniref:ABC transporter ATP-binding protein n=1 Tax=Calidifontibacillus erzurumensis TaxID=2741433 RepID=A0A8J8GDW5_9BACI|nr:ABC transporter ATP-binding protein [Calidifontibacillus erzurumensis]NSL51356.1 ABC transporter ATP-binding protein [Calidifontibacillus erzurumensis]
MAILEIDQVYHTYFSPKTATTALENISISIEEGEFISFLGPSGCGKTTLLSIIAGLIEPTSGTIKIDGIQVKNRKGLIGYMLQQDYLFPWKTIEENILLGLKIMKKDSEENRQRALHLLNEMNLGNVEKQYPRELSGGMRQRVALVRTLSTNPKILLLDEPFSALDYQTKLKLENLVFRTLKEYNKTALLVTHDIGEAIAMSDRIFLLKAKPGEIVQSFIVPPELKAIEPFEARQHPKFSELFQQIWEELNKLESKTTTT